MMEIAVVTVAKADRAIRIHEANPVLVDHTLFGCQVVVGQSFDLAEQIPVVRGVRAAEHLIGRMLKPMPIKNNGVGVLPIRCS